MSDSPATSPRTGTSPPVAQGGGLTVGQVASRCGVSVRTLHHYDDVGLVRPSCRSLAGYRLYADADLQRLQEVVVYRRLGFSLREVAGILDDPNADVAAHLRRQHRLALSRLATDRELLHALERALEADVSHHQLTPDERRALFGDSYSEELEQEAEDRWGQTEAWRQSRQRTASYDTQTWATITAEAKALTFTFAELKRSGEAPTSERALRCAEAHRAHIDTWFYELDHARHRGLADLYVSDPRFTANYDDVEPSLAAFVHDAIHANADAHDR